jgi:hypothetical protein
MNHRFAPGKSRKACFIGNVALKCGYAWMVRGGSASAQRDNLVSGIRQRDGDCAPHMTARAGDENAHLP